jgi:selenium metabolism protein YedF
MDNRKIVDCRGLACPGPVLSTREALQNATDPFTVIVDNEGACINVTRFAESEGARVTVDQNAGELRLTVEPGRGMTSPSTPSPVSCAIENNRNTVIYVSSETMGRGDDELGGFLMTAFLDTLAQFKGGITHAVFLNGGARLAITGSPVLQQVKQLQEIGVDILVC